MTQLFIQRHFLFISLLYFKFFWKKIYTLALKNGVLHFWTRLDVLSTSHGCWKSLWSLYLMKASNWGMGWEWVRMHEYKLSEMNGNTVFPTIHSGLATYGRSPLSNNWLMSKLEFCEVKIWIRNFYRMLFDLIFEDRVIVELL